MSKCLTNSRTDRQNILHNTTALRNIYLYSGIADFFQNDERYLSITEIAAYFKVDANVVSQCIIQNQEELVHNGYTTVKKDSIEMHLFNIKSFIDLIMLLDNSDYARKLRCRILGIMIDMINMKKGGGTLYIATEETSFTPVIVPASPLELLMQKNIAVIERLRAR